MMRRETLERMKWVVRKFGHNPSVNAERMLIDSHLEALNEIDAASAEIIRLRGVIVDLADTIEHMTVGVEDD